jgi:hypothetical protein
MPAKDLPIHPEQLPRIVPRDTFFVREDTLYTNHKGVEKTSLRKRADKALALLKDVLAKALGPDEVVLYVAPVSAPVSTLEQLTLGWAAYYISRSMLVVTNRRLLDFRVKGKTFGGWVWGRALRSIHLGDIAEAKASGGLFGGSLKLRYHDGTKEKYWQIKGVDTRKFRLLFDKLLPGSVGENTPARAPVSLCPNCVAALTPGQERCTQCQLAFATEREVVRRSILFPGGGYFYVGQTGLGVLDAYVEWLIIAVLVLWLLVAAGLPDPFLGPLDPYTTRAEALGVAIFVGVLLALEKLVTIFHGRNAVRRFYPLDKPPSTVKWAIWGIVAYGLMALVLWAIIPSPEKPLLTVGSDLVVYRAEFGLFDVTPEGAISFTPTSQVPRTPGRAYGFVLRFRTPQPNVKLRAHLELEAAPDLVLPPMEEVADATGGVIGRRWKVEVDEPQGRQTLKVYLNDTLVRSFTFTVK